MYSIIILLVSVCVLHGYHYYDEFQNDGQESYYQPDDYYLDEKTTQHDISTRKKLYKLVSDFVEYEKLKKRNNDEQNNDDRYEDETARYHAATDLDESNNPIQNNKVVEDVHEFRMPGIVPKQQDTYMCYAQKLPEEDRYISMYTYQSC